MKRILFSCLLGLLSLAAPISASENSYLKFEHSELDSIMCKPFRGVGIYFCDYFENLALIQKDSVATLFCDGEFFAEGKLDVINEESPIEYVIYSAMVARFDTVMLPPLGKSYRLHIPAGVVALERDHSIANEEINEYFTVPQYLPYRDNKNEQTVTSAIGFHADFDFNTEIGAFGNTYVYLYRKGIPVRRFDASVGWDWGWGHVDPWLNGINFENGVNYALVLPANQVYCIHRDDIVNKEERINFIGGKQYFPTLGYGVCDLTADPNRENLGEVRFSYSPDQAVILSPVAAIELQRNGETIETVTPTLAEENGKYILTADFKGKQLDPGSDYVIVVPEATIFTAEGDVVVNKRQYIDVRSLSGIDEVTKTPVSVTCQAGSLSIEQAPAGSPVAIYTLEGKAIANLTADGSILSLPLPHPGLYIVTVNGKAYKVVCM